MSAELEALAARDAARDAAHDARMRAELAARDAARDARMSAELARVTALLQARDAPGASSMTVTTAANVGTSVLDTLNAIRGAVTVFEPKPEAGPPIVDEALASRLLQCPTEAALVAALTPTLRALRGLHERGADAGDAFSLALVNSEERKWMDDLRAPLLASQRRKPDLFVTWALCAVPLGGHGADDKGALAGRALQLDGCAREFFEAKAGGGELTAADFGQLVDYHARTPGRARGLLFNARHAWLYESHNGHPVSLVKTALATQGSRELARDFLCRPLAEPPLIRLLRRLCSHLRVEATESAPGAGAFLGAGASGRVFCVRRLAAGGDGGSGDSGAQLFALKACCDASPGDVAFEFSQLASAAAAGAPVVRVVEDSLRAFFDDESGQPAGGGYLMAEVLTPCLVKSATQRKAAFATLAALHAAGFTHGDARKPNLLTRGGSLLWIDLRAASATSTPEAAQRADAATLAASICSMPVEAASALYARALAEIPGRGTQAYAELAMGLWEGGEE